MTYLEAVMVFEYLVGTAIPNLPNGDRKTEIIAALNKGIEACTICDSVQKDILNGKVAEEEPVGMMEDNNGES